MRAIIGRALWPGVGPVVNEGAVIVRQGRVLATGPWPRLRGEFSRAEILDLSDCLILPGFVNAHTHLELTHLKGRVEYNGDFPTWVRQVTRQRAHEQTLADVLAAGVRQSLAGGATLVGDISHAGNARQHLLGAPIRKVCFAETVGLADDVSPQQASLEEWLDEGGRDSWTQLGLSPHAPYSSGRRLYELTAQLAAKHDVRLTTHLAEMPAEAEFLQTGAGPWRAFLEDIGKWPASFIPPRCSPVEFFLDLDLAGQDCLLAHVNYLDDDELARLARTRHSVAFCPRSHRYFGHKNHRFRDMLAAGINVCLGTDSLASNDSLSMLDEIRFLHREYPDVPPEQLLAMATRNGARALAWDEHTGALEPGKEADLVAVQITPRDYPLREVLAGDGPVRMVMIAEEIVHGGVDYDPNNEW